MSGSTTKQLTIIHKKKTYRVIDSDHYNPEYNGERANFEFHWNAITHDFVARVAVTRPWDEPKGIANVSISVEIRIKRDGGPQGVNLAANTKAEIGRALHIEKTTRWD